MAGCSAPAHIERDCGRWTRCNGRTQRQKSNKTPHLANSDKQTSLSTPYFDILTNAEFATSQSKHACCYSIKTGHAHFPTECVYCHYAGVVRLCTIVNLQR